MRKIALPEDGIETLYGAHDANLKHIETLLNVDIRTHGGELTVEGAPATSSAHSSFSTSCGRSWTRGTRSRTAT